MMKSFIINVLTKLKFLNSDKELSMEMLLIWVFLLITAFRALFANVTITYGSNIKWTILDSNIGMTLPVLYGLLSQAHQNYLASKNQ